jgi:cytochrome c553
MVYAQGFVAAAIGVILLLWRPVQPRSPGWRAWIWSGFKLVGGLLLIGIGWLVYQLPASPVIPPQKAADVFLSQIYRPDTSKLPNLEQLAMVDRGRMLYTVLSCAMCHRGNGRGGVKISWRPFGTVWSRNISSDKTAGIGAWSDREIARAIRSGVSRDGGVLDWQGMIWDHASNLDEDDVRSIIAYLRTLPPVERKLPRPRAPAPEDCELAVFWLADDVLAHGCTGQ